MVFIGVEKIDSQRTPSAATRVVHDGLESLS